MLRLKKSIFAMFEPNENGAAPKEHGKIIFDLMGKPKGERPLWTLVNWPFVDQLQDINMAIKGVVDDMLTHFQVA